MGGTLALGVHHGLSSDHMDLANEIVKTCYQTYAIQPTFLAPEITYFNIEVIIIVVYLDKGYHKRIRGYYNFRTQMKKNQWICM